MSQRVGWPYHRGATINGVVAHHVRRAPDAVAVIDGAASLTYGALHRRARIISAALRRQGIASGAIVAVDCERSLDLVCVLLGILECGAAYVALDPAWPRSRKDKIAATCGVALRVVEEPNGPAPPEPTATPADLLTGEPELAVEPEIDEEAGGEDACCIFYTSGTSGLPKGIVSPHRATVRLLCDPEFVQLGPETRLLQNAPLPWDGLSLELWAPLLNGGSVVLNPDRSLTTEALRRFVGEMGVDTVWLSASLLNTLVDEDVGCFIGLRTVLTGGERASVDHLRRLLDAVPQLTVVNGYGPAESAIFATTHRVRAEDVAPGQMDVPVGRPVPRTDVLVLAEGADGRLVRVLPGAVGEIVIAGDGLGRYVGPDQGGFVDLEIDGRRVSCYRTGDLASVDPSGVLRFRGRRDRQVKLRGYRIELDEVEQEVLTLPGVRWATANVVSVGGAEDLVVWYLSDSCEAMDEAAMRADLTETLPAHLVPASLVWLPRLPTGRTGKLERARLPLPVWAPQGRVGDHADPISASIAQSAARLLDLESVGGRDQLLTELRMSSLQATRLAGEMARRWGVEILVKDVYRCPTTDALAEVVRTRRTTIDERSADPVGEAASPPVAGAPTLSAGQRRFWLAERTAPGEAGNLAVEAFAIEGVLDVDRLADALLAVVRRHPQLRLRVFDVGGEPAARALSSEQVVDLGLEVRHEQGDVDDPDRFAMELATEAIEGGIDLAAGPPLRMLVSVGHRRAALALVIHHIVVDGRALTTMLTDLAAAYRATEGEPLAARTGAFMAYVVAERAYLDSVKARRDRSFWREAVRGGPPVKWPRNDPRPSANRGVTKLAIEPAIVAGMTAGALAAGTPVLAVYLKVLSDALFDILGTRPCLGTVLEGRLDAEDDQVVGFFSQTVPVPVDGARLTAYGAALLAVMDHARLPFEEIVAAVNPERHDRHPLFQVAVVLQQEPVVRVDLDGAIATRVELPPAPAPFDVLLEVFPAGAGAVAVLQSTAVVDGLCHDAIARALRTHLRGWA